MSKFIAAALAGALMTASLTTVAMPVAAYAQAAKISFADTKIEVLIKDPKAKAILEKNLPEITQFYDQIGTMSLTEVVPMSQGAIDEGKIKTMQAEYDKG